MIFFIYTGTKNADKEKCTSEAVVLKLCENLPKHWNHRLVFYNWLTTLNLCLQLLNSELHLVRWCNNSCVQLVSTFAGVKASKTVKRWDGKSSEHVHVKCPDLVALYNETMGGVDLADMLIVYTAQRSKQKGGTLQ